MSWDKVNKDIESGPLGAFIWSAILVLVAVIFLGGISLFIKPASMATDRLITKNSFQYKEGMAQRAAILQANIAEVEILLQGSPENRSDLEAQKVILSAHLRAITISE